MIIRLRGIIIEKIFNNKVMLEIQGITYEVNISTICFNILPNVGEEVILYSHFSIRENYMILFGFINKDEQYLFKKLIKIIGIGPKLALSILSEISFDEFIKIIENKNIEKLKKLSGIGKKTAERLLIEMQDYVNKIILKKDINKFSFSKNTNDEHYNCAKKEAICALIRLGYKPNEAKNMIHSVYYDNADCESLIRYALRIVT